ncbi:hypothetical protein QE152_g40208 [Popillia japonica]|uniref:HTH CENPB-type domain-containing protein n=1 Tax=Popillia japonica TaxID=7064 RepID=A0AAW1HSJ9_POPJA
MRLKFTLQANLFQSGPLQELMVSHHLAAKVSNTTTQDKKVVHHQLLILMKNTIIKWILDGGIGIPVTKNYLLNAVENYASSSNNVTPFIGKRPGTHWFEGFRRRHSNLTIRTPQHLSNKRAEVAKTYLQEWFSEQKEYLSSKNFLNISSGRAFNCD